MEPPTPHAIHPPTAASVFLLELAQRLVPPYARLPTARAGMVSGSSAKGLADQYSDLDILLYYDGELPTEDELTALRKGHGGSERKFCLGDRAEGEIVESYFVQGVEVQLAHSTIATWEAQMAKVLVELDCDSPLQKALEGTLAGRALFGEELVAEWQRRASAYPPALGVAMVRRHLAFFPMWALEHQFRTRDATVFYYESLVACAQHLMGVLAGLNGAYFTTFQVKRMGRFLAPMKIAPRDVAERLEDLFRQDRERALPRLKTLVEETVALVEAHLPEVDTSAVRALLARRAQVWAVPASPGTGDERE
ncbi:MAG: nucleotidyltransferase domain-containing protein [bacterium]